MARTKNRPAAPSAAHAAPDPAPPPAAAPAPGSPAAAVWAALSANPGATTAVIADAAGTGRPAARDALLAMEAAGTATRVKGGKPGTPDTWALAEPTQPGADPAPEDEQNGHPGSSPDGARENKAADGTGQGDTAQPGNPAPQDDDTQARASTAPDPTTGQPEPHDHAPAGDGHDDAPLGEQDGQAMPDSGHPQDPHEVDGAADEDAAADPNGEPSDPTDPALVTEIGGRIAQIKAAADAAAIVLTGGRDLRGALAALDEIAEQAAQARRSLKAATSGRKAPAARPGGLRDKVLAHLDEHPDGQFTPHEIHKVLSHSSGAIANALDTLVKLGDAELATEKPRRFRRATKPAAAKPEADSANNAKDGTELAGAA
jgi:hypothetical protein